MPCALLLVVCSGVCLRQLCRLLLQKEKLQLNDGGRRTGLSTAFVSECTLLVAAKIRDFSGVRLRWQPIGGFFLTVLGYY